MRGFIGPEKVAHKYADRDMRDYVGLTMHKAVEDAQAFADHSGRETLVYFKRWDHDLEPDVRRYDWCTARTALREQFPDGDRIEWSSEEGYY